jgi:raffinose/stachyose/melibiose transport system substrate-binding protein
MTSRLFGFVRRWFALGVVLAVFAWAVITILATRGDEGGADTIVLRVGHWQLEAGVRDGINALGADYQEVWHKQWENGGKNAEGKVWREIYPDKPKVKIVQDAIPETVYGQWVTTQLIGGTAPDMMEIGGTGGIPRAMEIQYWNRYFYPIRPYINRPNPHNAGTELADVPFRLTFKDALRGGYVEELQEYVAFPVSQFAVRIFYNKDLLKKLTGLDKAPTEYRAFLAACEKIQGQKNAQRKPYTAIASSAYHFQMWEGNMFNMVTYPALRKIDFNRDGLAGNDEVYTAFKIGRVSFDYPPYRAKFKMIREVSQYFQNGYTGLNRDDAVFLFAQQRAVFITTGTWDARGLQQQAEGKFSVGVMDFPMPLATDPDYGPYIEGPIYERPGSGAPFGITRFSKYPDVAVDFMLFLCSQRGNEKLNQYFGWIPSIIHTKQDPLLDGFEPHLVGVYEAINVNLGGETLIKWQQVISEFQVDPKYTIDDLQRDFEPFYKDRGLKDFREQLKDWLRGVVINEQGLAGMRARALVAEGDQAQAEWIRYRATLMNRQVLAEIWHNMQSVMVEQGPILGDIGPYEYSPEVLDKIRARLKKENGGTGH